MSLKKSLLVVSVVLVLFVNTMSADRKYCHKYNREKFLQAVQMLLSKKLRTVCEFFFRSWNLDKTFLWFEKKIEPHSLNIFGIIDSEKQGYLNS